MWLSLLSDLKLQCSMCYVQQQCAESFYGFSIYLVNGWYHLYNILHCIVSHPINARIYRWADGSIRTSDCTDCIFSSSKHSQLYFLSGQLFAQVSAIMIEFRWFYHFSTKVILFAVLSLSGYSCLPSWANDSQGAHLESTVILCLLSNKPCGTCIVRVA
uniref:Uncharacterized protein n=1 Tax=Arundo donax TaxID=35708 RepID=A0A0A9F817_ARUDO